MLLLKIANKSFFLPNLMTHNYTKHLSHNVQILKFAKEEIFSFYVR